MSEPLIADVSDTARWVAVYRAQESARPDALFQDPLAQRLAGDKGGAIATAAQGAMGSGWPIISRTALLDDLILRAVQGGCDVVVNLAAGMDTRPYRLELPEALRWVEVDLPGIIEEKERVLAGERARCRLTREKGNLADPAVRKEVLDRALGSATRALVVTEGLLPYLEPDAVRALASDLARPPIAAWLLDITSPALAAMVKRRMGKQMNASPFRFAPEDGVAFFEALGWKVEEVSPIFRAAARLKRLPLFLRLFALFPDPNPRRPGRSMWSAVVRLTHG